VNKAAILTSIIDALRADFDTLRSTSQKTRTAGNDAESKAEGKYDTRSTEDNYLADGLARQAHGAAQAGAAYEDFTPVRFRPDSRIDLGALVQLEFPDETHWFFLGPAGGGIEVIFDGMPITVLTPESPLGSQLMGLKTGDLTISPEGKVLSVE
jgi:transcription elongation GreA/GreB family factor